MIAYENLRKAVVSGLKEYLGVEVIKTNTNSNPPKYPYIAYTVTTIESATHGTYGEYEDGKNRKPTTLTMSISALSDDDSESVSVVTGAYDWLDHVGTTYLSDNGVIVQELTNITNRDNVLTVDYEYKKGFDVVFRLFNEVEAPKKQNGTIESVDFTNIEGEG